MELNNGTPYPAGFTLAMDSDGRPHAVVVVKGSFEFPERPHLPCLVSAQQEPLQMADTFWGEPGYSPPRQEMDFAHVKRHSDILLEASAHAPDGRPVERLQAGIRVGSWAKGVDVFGDRVWLSGTGPPKISAARPFVTMPLSYDRAFGGVDRSDPDDPAPEAYAPNPVGKGWHLPENAGRLNGQPLPNIETAGEPVEAPWGDYRPAGFGPVGRGWTARLRHAGTYDDDWLENTFPFLPADFDPLYYQAAPEDQWIDAPSEGTEVVLVNLTPDGRTGFRLPRTDLPFVFARQRAEDIHLQGHLDTIFIDAAARRFTLTWRASVPIRRDPFELCECIIGPRPRGFWRARALGKAYYPSLRDMVRANEPEDAE